MISAKTVIFEVNTLGQNKCLELDYKTGRLLFKKRHIIDSYTDFIQKNKEALQYIGVDLSLKSKAGEPYLYSNTNKYIGAAPLVNNSGQSVGDFIVKPNYLKSENISDLIELIRIIESEVNIEINTDSLPLKSGEYFKPPIYYEVIKFLDALTILTEKKWMKFRNKEIINDVPTGSVNWNKYIANSYRVENRLRFPVSKNILDMQHDEFKMLKYVFELSKKEIYKSSTPIRIRSMVAGEISALDKKLSLLNPKLTNELKTSTSDPFYVKNVKKLANNVLKKKGALSNSWRLEMSDVFEKYVQHIFHQSAKMLGLNIRNNKIIKGFGTNSGWQLKHLEPDTILESENKIFYIDAKYKSHLYNLNSKSEKLKKDFRSDLHQILAYSSFNTSKHKKSAIVYPSSDFFNRKLKYSASYNNTSIEVYLIGLPIKTGRQEIKELIGNVTELINVLKL